MSRDISHGAPMVVDIDLLLTSATTTEARDTTKARRSACAPSNEGALGRADLVANDMCEGLLASATTG
jgi:hypothetical protein